MKEEFKKMSDDFTKLIKLEIRKIKAHQLVLNQEIEDKCNKLYIAAVQMKRVTDNAVGKIEMRFIEQDHLSVRVSRLEEREKVRDRILELNK